MSLISIYFYIIGMICSAILANRLGRNPSAWFFISLVASPAAAIALLLCLWNKEAEPVETQDNPFFRNR